MARASIKLFQCVLRRYKTIGICPNQNDRFQWHKRAFIVVILILNFISTGGFFLFKAETHGELSNSFCVSSTILCCTTLLIISAYKINEIEKFVEKMEAHIETSKFDIINLIKFNE